MNHINLRFDISKDKYQQVIEAVKIYFKNINHKTHKILSCFENEDRNGLKVKDHVHTYIKTEGTFKTSLKTIKDNFWTFIKEKCPDILKTRASKAFEMCDNYEKVEIYNCKHGDQLEAFGYSVEELEEIRAKNDAINEDKKRSARSKVFDYMIKHKPRDTYEYINLIHKLYIDEFNKTPPPRHVIISSMQYYFHKTDQPENLFSLLNIQHLNIAPPDPNKFNTEDFKDNDKYETVTLNTEETDNEEETDTEEEPKQKIKNDP